MKKLLALFLCSLALLSLSACVSQADVDAAYQRGYKAGYSEGETAGYDDGYEDGYVVGYDTGCADTEPVALEAGRTEGYEDGYTKGFDAGSESFEQGYALGYAQGQAIIDADISQKPEYKSWAKSYPQLNNNDLDADIRRQYDSLHLAIDSWQSSMKNERYEMMQNKSGDTFLTYVKCNLLRRVTDNTVMALHNMVDNLMLFENSHLSAEGIFVSNYNALETSLTDSGTFDYENSYDAWLANHPALQSNSHRYFSIGHP